MAMGRLSLILLFLIVAGLMGGVGFLAMWDIPPPTEAVEKVISNDRFPR